ncbi:MAG: hypothetical protein V1780_00955 [Chloroflexota bacterium]
MERVPGATTRAGHHGCRYGPYLIYWQGNQPKSGLAMKPSWKDSLTLKLKRALGMNILLCDSCKWNWRSACHDPARPNATRCPEYAKRGR